MIFEIKNSTYNQEKANNLLFKSGIILIQCEARILRTPFSLTGMYALVTIPLSSGQVSPDTCQHPLLSLMTEVHIVSTWYYGFSVLCLWGPHMLLHWISMLL